MATAKTASKKSETKTPKKKATKKTVKKEPAENADPVTKAPSKAQSAEESAAPEFSVRGRSFTGIVISARMSKTVTVEWPRRKYVPKYQRYEKRRTRVKAHDELGANVGDTVEIRETRPISKTKNFLVTRIIKQA